MSAQRQIAVGQMADDTRIELLIKGCLNGDRRSQQAVYRMFYGKMKVVCMRYARDNDQALDILQEGFIKVFQNMDKYTGTGSFEGWVRRIMVNLAIDYFRRSKHDVVLLNQNHSVEDWEEEVEDEDDNEVVYDFKASQIIEAMQQLTPAYRTIFNLYVFENLAHKDIADKLGINIGTSKSNYAKAKRNIKKILLRDFSKANEQNTDTL